MEERVILSEREGRGIKADGVELDSGVVAWTGFDSSRWPFLQQEDSRKSNRQEETLRTITSATDSGHMLSSGTQQQRSCKQHTEQRHLSEILRMSVGRSVRCTHNLLFGPESFQLYSSSDFNKYRVYKANPAVFAVHE